MIYVLLANGFEEIEVVTPIDIMRRAGLSVELVSVSGKKEVCGAHEMILSVDITADEIDMSDMDMLILPGGPGHVHLDGSKRVHELIEYAVKNEIYIAAICAAPSIIGKLGLLDGKKATAFPGFEKYLSGAHVVSDKAVSDGKFITGKGPGAAAEFGFMIVSELKGEKCAAELKESMQY